MLEIGSILGITFLEGSEQVSSSWKLVDLHFSVDTFVLDRTFGPFSKEKGGRQATLHRIFKEEPWTQSPLYSDHEAIGVK